MKQLCQIKENFTAVPNLILLDKNLTEKEKILYLYLLSKQTKKDDKDYCITVKTNNWIFYSDKVSKDLDIDYKTLKKRLKSLETKEYIKCIYDETGKIFGKPKGFKVSLFYQDNEIKRTGETEKEKEKLLVEDIKKQYRLNCRRYNIRKKSLMFPNQRQWNVIFDTMGKYKYLIPYIPFCFSYMQQEYSDSPEFQTFYHLFNNAFPNFYCLIDFLLIAKKKDEIMKKYEKGIDNNKSNPEVVEMLKFMMKEDLENYERIEKDLRKNWYSSESILNNYDIKNLPISPNLSSMIEAIMEQENEESID